MQPFVPSSASSVLGCRSHVLLRMSTNTDDDGGAAAAALLAEEYEMMEQMVAQRGEVEELLMADSDMRPLLPNELASGAGVGGVGGVGAGVVKEQRGFGGSSAADRKKKKRKKWTQKEAAPLPDQPTNKGNEAKGHAQVLKTEGLVRIDNILSESITDTLRDFVYNIQMCGGCH